MAQELYHSKAPLPSLRRTAHQMHPGIARMTGGQGLKQVGEAMFQVGLQMHQVNIARQVAEATANYKMAEADFMAEMMNADPSKVSYDQKWAEFKASQSELAAGVSRDAGAIIQNKIKMMQASDYKSLKQMEIVNQRALVANEAPAVLDSCLREQVKAEMNGNPERAAQARQNCVDWIAGTSPAWRPGEGEKMMRMYDAALGKARTEEEANRFAGEVMKDPFAAEQMIEDGQLKYQDGRQLLSLRSQARGQQGSRVKQGKLQEYAMLNDQGKNLNDQLLSGNTITPPEGMDPVFQETVDIINEQKGDGMDEVMVGETHPIYYQYKAKLESFTDQNPLLNEADIFLAAAVLTPDQIKELRTMNDENRKLLPHKEEMKTTVAGIHKKFNVLEQAMYQMIKNEDYIDVIRREARDAKARIIKDVRAEYIKGTPHLEIVKQMQETFEGTKEGILEVGALGWRKIKTGISAFVPELEKGTGKTAADIEAHRFQAVMNLLYSGKHSRQIEAAIKAGWFYE